MKKFTLLLLSLTASASIAYCTSYTSAGSGSWTTPATWSPAGVPSATDDATILSGHNVTTSSSPQSIINNLTINAGGTITTVAGASLQIKRLLTNNGDIAGTGAIGFRRADGGIVISGTGTWSHTGDLWFNNPSGVTTQIIAVGVVINKAGNFWLFNNSNSVWVTNNGSVTLTSGSIYPYNSGSASKWTQGGSSFLSLNKGLYATAFFTLDAAAANNTITYTGANYAIKNPTGGQYANLIITSAIKTFNFDLIVADLTVNAAGTLNRFTSTNNITISGNWTANGTILSGTPSGGTVTFNGTGAQTIGGAASAQQFPNLTLSGSGSVTLARPIQANNDITISSGTLDVSASNYQITARGNWTNNGTFVPQSGNVTFNNAAQSIGGSSTTGFYDITIGGSGAKTLSGAVTIADLFTVSLTGAGSFNSGTGSCTFLSTPALTAKIATIPAAPAFSFAGTGYQMQRYITSPTGTANYQDMTSPATSATLQDWDLQPNFWFSADDSNDGCAGAGPPCTYVSAYTYTGGPFVGIHVLTGRTINPGEGIELWMGDDLSSFSPKTFYTPGTPNAGTVSRAITAAGDGYNIVGNPYQCPIKWTSLNASNTSTIGAGATFLIFDETTGNYESSDGTTGTGARLAANPNILVATQGFWVYCTSGGSLSFMESHKTMSEAPIIAPALYSGTLRFKVSSNVNSYWGESVIKFSPEASETFGSGDAIFKRSRYDNAPAAYFINSERRELKMSRLAADKDELDMTLAVLAPVAGEYELGVAGVDMLNDYSCVSLENPATGEVIDLTKTNQYKFKSTGSEEPKKFIVHFSRNGNCRMPQQGTTLLTQNNVNVFSNENGVFADFNFDSSTPVVISAYNMLGESVMESKQVNVLSGKMKLDIPAMHNIYLVTVTVNGQTISRRVFY